MELNEIVMGELYILPYSTGYYRAEGIHEGRMVILRRVGTIKAIPRRSGSTSNYLPGYLTPAISALIKLRDEVNSNYNVNL